MLSDETMRRLLSSGGDMLVVSSSSDEDEDQESFSCGFQEVVDEEIASSSSHQTIGGAHHENTATTLLQEGTNLNLDLFGITKDRRCEEGGEDVNTNERRRDEADRDLHFYSAGAKASNGDALIDFPPFDLFEGDLTIEEDSIDSLLGDWVFTGRTAPTLTTPIMPQRTPTTRDDPNGWCEEPTKKKVLPEDDGEEERDPSPKLYYRPVVLSGVTWSLHHLSFVPAPHPRRRLPLLASSFSHRQQQ